MIVGAPKFIAGVTDWGGGEDMPTNGDPFDPLAIPPPPPSPAPPNIDTRSSSGLLEVPASRFAAAGVEVRVVAARPEGWLSPPD